MFRINKLFDKEWYFRKFTKVITPFISKYQLERIELKHQISNEYQYTFGKKLHWNNPITLNEKLIWLSWYWRHPLKTLCADKFKLREYVTNTCGLPDSLLVPILGVYNNVDDINFDSLPNEFVMKCNHGCGYNILVPDKSVLDVKSSMHTLRTWLSGVYMGGVGEIHYLDITPHLIICEKYLPALGDSSIVDYKVHCINGNPEFVLVCYDRDENEVAKLATFDKEWNQLYYVINEENVKIEKPKSLDRMYEYSSILSNNFPFVRVDFYDVDGIPYLGEMTFTPYGNMIDYYKDDVQISLGKKLKLPKPYKE